MVGTLAEPTVVVSGLRGWVGGWGEVGTEEEGIFGHERTTGIKGIQKIFPHL